MKLKRLVCFRVDGGAKLGMGHLFKSLILANALKKQIHDAGILFLIKEDDLGIKWLKKSGCRFLKLPKGINRSREPHWMIENIPQADKVLFAIDILDVSKKYVVDLKKHGFKVVIFENKQDSRFAADVTVNALVKGLNHGISRFRNGSIELRGAKYRVFHPDYLRFSRNSVRNGNNTVLITMGGGADNGFVAKLVHELKSESKTINLTVVRGPAQKIMRLPVSVLPPQKSLAACLNNSCLAVTAGGGTLYELAYMRVPGIALSKVTHQVRNIKMFQKNGTVIFGGPATSANARKTAVTVLKLLKNMKRRTKMKRAGRRLVDGLGAERIVKQMVTLLKGE